MAAGAGAAVGAGVGAAVGAGVGAAVGAGVGAAVGAAAGAGAAATGAFTAGAGAAGVAGAAADTAAGAAAALGVEPRYDGRLVVTQPGAFGSSTGGAPPATSRRTSTTIFWGDVDSAVVAAVFAVAGSTLTNGPMNDIRTTFALMAAPARITRVDGAA